MAFHRTMALCLRAGKNAAPASGAGAAIPRPPAPHPPARRCLPAVEDCPTLAFLRPKPTAVGYATATVPLPAHCFPALPVGDHLFHRLQLDGLIPPVSTASRPPPPEHAGVTVEQARKVARAAEMEVARARLRSNAQTVVSGSEFAALCVDIAGGVEGGRRLSRALDESGGVIVLGDAVFLRPDMVAKAIGSILPGPGKQQPQQATAPAPRGEDEDESEAQKRELEAMEAQKAAIDAEAAAQVQRELEAMEAQKAAIDAEAGAQVWREMRCGLGLLVAQTLVSMRLTFWELSWDVMEPVCFYVASLYFLSSFAFFMRTATEPSFEGFFRSRFASKQRRLMRARGFDVDRYNALRKGQGSRSSRRP